MGFTKHNGGVMVTAVGLRPSLAEPTLSRFTLPGGRLSHLARAVPVSIAAARATLLIMFCLHR